MAGEDRLRPGSVFAGDFEIVEPLGEGGMGSVYVARQRSTGALRALKLMAKDLVRSPALREKFEQEARISARIESDHVAHVLAAGIDSESGLPWIAMELLRGETLAARIERGLLPWPYILAVFEQMGHALAAAHRQGIVHRDLKPENVFLGAPRTAGVEMMVKLLDFGIAKVVAESTTNQTGMLGTPTFMAPEQYQGRGIGPATDVWAMGLLAFQLLTGRSYWRSATGSASSPASLMFETCSEDLSPASTRAAEMGVAQFLPAAFDVWFARCVARDPKARYADAAEALAGMRAVGTEPGTSSTAPVPPPVTGTVAAPAGVPLGGLPPRRDAPTELSAARRSRRTLVTGVGVLAVLGIGGGIAAVALQSPRERSEGVGTTTGVTAVTLARPETPKAPPQASIPPPSAEPAPSAPATTTDPAPPQPTASAARRSPVPTIGDWNVVGEVTVTGSTALSCETKMIREWLRISCSGKNDTGGTPTSVEVRRGADPDTETFAAGGVTTLVLPYVEGMNAEALFSWTDKSKRLLVTWPRGTPLPAVKARFADL